MASHLAVMKIKYKVLQHIISKHYINIIHIKWDKTEIQSIVWT